MPIVACGGAIFEGDGARRLQRFILSLAGADLPRVCFLPTATGDNPESVARFYRAAAGLDCRPSDLPLFRREVADLRSFLLAQDVIWVAGGNTANMLAIWRVHGVDAILREAWDQGVVLCGSSAGMNCWFEASVTDSFSMTELAALNDGLGFLAGSACPHYDAEAERRPVYRRLVAEGFPAGYAADDGVGIVFEGTERVDVVAHREGAAAYWVSAPGPGGEVSEERLEARAV
jgi:dipeptidase E